MALRAAGVDKKSTPQKVDRADDRVESEPQVLPLKLGPLVAPFRKQGRLSLRIERMPRRARLSAGRNNGDGSWSVSTDELDGLKILMEGKVDAATLGVRVFKLEAGVAQTLAVVDFELTPGGADSEADPPPRRRATDSGAEDPQVRRMRDELAEMKSALAAHESDLAKMRQKEGAAAETKQKAEVELARGRDEWAKELEQRLNDAAAKAAAELQIHRQAWEKEFSAKAASDLQAHRTAWEKEVAAKTAADIQAQRQRWEKEATGKFALELQQHRQAWEKEVTSKFSSDFQHQRQAWEKEISTKLAADVERQRQAWERDAAAKLAAELQQHRAQWENEAGARAASDLHQHRQAWEKAASAEVAVALQQHRQAWEAEQKTHVSKSDARVQESLAAARDRWQQEAKDALSKAEQLWRAEAEARLAKADAQWQEKLKSAQVQLQARDLSKDGEVGELRQALATLEASVKERDAALARAGLDFEDARKAWRHETQLAVAKAEQAARTEAEAKFNAVALQWKQETAAAVAQAQAGAKNAQDGNESELNRLREETASLRAMIVERETALAAAKTDSEQARERWHRETEQAVLRAHQAWKTDEATRLAAAAAQWEEKAPKVQADATKPPPFPTNDTESRHLREEVTALKAALAEREKALTEAQTSAGAKTKEDWQREMQETLAKTEQAWKADAASRVAAAEAEIKKKSAHALAEATARYEAAESALIQQRIKAKDESRLHEEVTTLRAALAKKDSELAQLRVTAEPARTFMSTDANAGFRQFRAAASQISEPTPRKRGYGRDIIIAAVLGVALILLYPLIDPMLPYSWRVQIAQLTGSVENSLVSQVKKPEATPKDEVATPVPEASSTPEEALPSEQMVVALKDANVRGGPSSSDPVVSKLKRGREAALLERDGSWVRVRIDSEDGTESQEGWVHDSLIEDVVKIESDDD
jgi:hypothetical protein